MEVSSIHQNPIVNVELSSFFKTKLASVVVDSFEDVVDVVMHCSHSVEPFLCNRVGEFVVIIKVYNGWIKTRETSVEGEFVGSGGCGIITKFCKR